MSTYNNEPLINFQIISFLYYKRPSILKFSDLEYHPEKKRFKDKKRG